MNRLEELSRQNRENYERYLKRMTESIRNSTKGFLPIMARQGKRILDVGCGSGVLLYAIAAENPEAELTGLDLNEEAINSLRASGAPFDLIHGDFLKLVSEDPGTPSFSFLSSALKGIITNTSSSSPILEKGLSVAVTSVGLE